jgi:transposase
MKYSSGFKSSVLRKVLPPENQAISKVAKESGLAEQTLRNWIFQVKNGKSVCGDSGITPGERSYSEKLTLLLESRTLPEERFGEWLRTNGLHSEHPELFEQELRMALSEHDRKIREELKNLKKENASLKKELARKEKALSEASALIFLKKKVEDLWAEKEEE